MVRPAFNGRGSEVFSLKAVLVYLNLSKAMNEACKREPYHIKHPFCMQEVENVLIFSGPTIILHVT